MLPSSELGRHSDLGTPRKRATGGGSSYSGSSTSGAGSDAFRASKSSGLRRSTNGGSAQKRRLLILGAIGGVVVAAVLIGVLAWAIPNAHSGSAVTAPPAGAPASSSDVAMPAAKPAILLDSAYCSRLPVMAQMYCNSYYKAPGSGRFSAAAMWQKMDAITYNCAGINNACLMADLKADRIGSACQTLADGDKCQGDAQCSAGLCGGLAALKLEQAPVVEAKQQGMIKEDKTSVTGATPDASAAAASIAAQGPPAPKAVVNGWGEFQATVNADAPLMRVPETFLATSHEWDRITDYADNIDAFAEIFKVFGPSPIMRMGGASQDAMTEVPKQEIWEALAKIQKAFNARFLIGLPLWRPDSVAMARKMMQLAEQYLPKESLMGFELGNEPEFWPTSVGGYESAANSSFVPGFEAYANYFARTATALNPCGPGQSPKLAGPGWGNVNTIDAGWMAMQAKAAGARCYMRELSVHYYPYVNNVTIDSRSLLSQDLQNFGIEKFQWLHGVAKATNLKLRISETNSLYGGGRAGLSDTVAGTMWCADALFAFANAGATGFHFHWGFGGRPYYGGQPNTGVQTNFFRDSLKPYPSVHAPWYGYLLFRTATAGLGGGFSDTTLVNVNTNAGSCGANVKVWGLLTDEGGVRVALLNKDMYTPCNVAVTLDSMYCGSTAALHRLMPGKKGMDSKDGITWRGQTYDNAANGKLQGSAKSESLRPVAAAGGKCSVTVPMPVASGAVLEVARAASR